MGRDVRRVPLDFDWPLNVAWEGFINPLYTAAPCEVCNLDGDSTGGYSPEAKQLHGQWYGHVPFHPNMRGSTPFTIDDEAIRRFAQRNLANAPEYYGTGFLAERSEARRLCELFNDRWSHHLDENDVAALVEAERLHDLTHTWNGELGCWLKKEPWAQPTPREVGIWSIQGFGHDSINCSVVITARCKRLGYEVYCHHCHGSGDIWPSEAAQKAYDEWEPTPPPTGEGWQMWGNTSEDHPISPVFATPEALANWLVDNNKTVFAYDTATYEQWMAIIEQGYTLDMMIVNNEIITSGEIALRHKEGTL